jgi:hypothetical protein
MQVKLKIVFAAWLAIGCGGTSVAPTSTPPPTQALVTPATPAPTATASPTAEPISTPTQSPTPTSTVSTSPLLSIDTIISDHPGPGDPEAVKELMRTAYAGNPHLEDLLGVLDRCAKGKTDTYEECLIGFRNVYDTGDPEYWGSDSGYLATGEMIFYEIAKGFYEVALSSHRENRDKDRLDGELRTEFPSP